MPPAGFEPTIPASEQQQTDALDGAATGTYVTDVRRGVFLRETMCIRSLMEIRYFSSLLGAGRRTKAQGHEDGQLHTR